MTQLIDFERIKEHGEKTILVANTFNTTPVSERKDKESFTPPALEFLTKFPVLLITGLDLYHMVQDVLDNVRSREEILQILYNGLGQLNYCVK